MEIRESTFDRTPRYDPSGNSTLNEVGKGLRAQLAETNWKEVAQENPLTLAKLEEYLLEAFSRVTKEEPHPLDVFKEVYPGVYYLGYGMYGGIGALENVQKEMSKLASNLLDSSN